MELRLEKFISSIETLSDVRNLDPFNPIVVQLEHPINAMRYQVVASIPEPSHLGIPINCIWVVMDSNSAQYKSALKLKAVTREDYVAQGGDATLLIDGLTQAWIKITTYDEIFSDPQIYSSSQGPKGDKGDKGDPAEIDLQELARLVAAIIGTPQPSEKTLVINGADNIIEGATQQFAVNLIEGSDSTALATQIVATTGAEFVTINSTNQITAKQVTADQTVILTATYVSGGKTLTATKTITVKNSDLASIALTGLATSLFEGKTSQLTVTASYGNGSTVNVTTTASYAVAPSSAGSVSASGLFTAASNLNADTNATITATYVEGGVTKTASLSTQVKNIIVASLAIAGNASVNEKTTAQFTATATRNDATTATVTPTWSVSPSSAGTITASGLFTAADVSADVSATISASYVFEGVTVNATKAVTVKNVAAVISPYYGVASATSTRNAELILSLTGRGPNGDRKMNPCTMTSGAGQSYFYAYPVSYGLASFVDLSNNFEGGMDGASGDGGRTLGPITVNVTLDGVVIPFYLYQSDKANLGLTNWDVR